MAVILTKVDGEVELWDIASNAKVGQFESLGDDSVFTVSKDEKILIVATGTRVTVLQTPDLKVLESAQVQGLSGRIYQIKITDDLRLLSFKACNSVETGIDEGREWSGCLDYSSGVLDINPLRPSAIPDNYLKGIALLSPDGRFLIKGGRLYDVSEWTQPQTGAR